MRCSLFNGTHYHTQLPLLQSSECAGLAFSRNVLTSIPQTAETGLEYPTQSTLLGMARDQSSVPLISLSHRFDIAEIHTGYILQALKILLAPPRRFD